MAYAVEGCLQDGQAVVGDEAHDPLRPFLCHKEECAIQGVEAGPPQSGGVTDVVEPRSRHDICGPIPGDSLGEFSGPPCCAGGVFVQRRVNAQDVSRECARAADDGSFDGRHPHSVIIRTLP